MILALCVAAAMLLSACGSTKKPEPAPAPESVAEQVSEAVSEAGLHVLCLNFLVIIIQLTQDTNAKYFLL